MLLSCAIALLLIFLQIDDVKCQVYLLPEHGSKVLAGELSVDNIGVLDSSTDTAARPVDITVDSVDFAAVRGTVYSAWKTEALLEVEVNCDVASTVYAYYIFPLPMPNTQHTFKKKVDLRASPAQSSSSGPAAAPATTSVQQSELHLRGESAASFAVTGDGEVLIEPVDAQPYGGNPHSFHGWKAGEQFLRPAAASVSSIVSALASVKVVDNTIIIPVHYVLGTDSALLPSSVEEAVVHVPAICYYVGDDVSAVQWSMCTAAFDVDLVAAEVALDTTLTISCANLDPAAETSSCGALLPYLVMRQDFLNSGKFVLVADSEKGGRKPTFPELLLGTQHQTALAVTTKHSASAANAKLAAHIDQPSFKLASSTAMTCIGTDSLLFFGSALEACIEGRNPVSLSFSYGDVSASAFLSSVGDDAMIYFDANSYPAYITGVALSHFADNAYLVNADSHAHIPDWDVDVHLNTTLQVYKNGNSVGMDVSRLYVRQGDENPLELAVMGAVSTPDKSTIELLGSFTSFDGESTPVETGSIEAGFRLQPDDHIAVKLYLLHNAKHVLDLHESYNTADLVRRMSDVLSMLIENAAGKLGFGDAIGKVDLGLTYHPDILPDKLPTSFRKVPKFPAFSWQMLGDRVTSSKDLRNLVRWVDDFFHNRLSGYTSLIWNVDNSFMQTDSYIAGYAGENYANAWIHVNGTIGDVLTVGFTISAYHNNWENINFMLYDNDYNQPFALQWYSSVVGREVNVMQVMVTIMSEIALRSNFHAVVDTSPYMWTAKVDSLYADFYDSNFVSNGTATVVCDLSPVSMDFNAAVFDHTDELMFAANTVASAGQLKKVVVRTNSFLFPTIDSLKVQVGEAFRYSALLAIYLFC